MRNMHPMDQKNAEGKKTTGKIKRPRPGAFFANGDTVPFSQKYKGVPCTRYAFMESGFYFPLNFHDFTAIRTREIIK